MRGLGLVHYLMWIKQNILATTGKYSFVHFLLKIEQLGLSELFGAVHVHGEVLQGPLERW